MSISLGKMPSIIYRKMSQFVTSSQLTFDKNTNKEHAYQ